MEVRLDIPDIDRRQQQFAGCDAVLLTFEMPRETLQHTLTQLNQLHIVSVFYA
jgi:ribokinase